MRTKEEKKQQQRAYLIALTALTALTLDLTLFRPTALSISRRRVTAAPVHHRSHPLSISPHHCSLSLSVSLPIRFEKMRKFLVPRAN
ncbi:hypothetical protein P8452_04380 [Trifolium repens]|nr:hypothetical protein P8452_04380 [Trifolium repens]